jgi:hypothetical protein
MGRIGTIEVVILSVYHRHLLNFPQSDSHSIFEPKGKDRSLTTTGGNGSNRTGLPV